MYEAKFIALLDTGKTLLSNKNKKDFSDILMKDGTTKLKKNLTQP